MKAILRLNEWEKEIELPLFAIRAGYIEEEIHSPLTIVLEKDKLMPMERQETRIVRFWYKGRTKKSMPVFEYYP